MVTDPPLSDGSMTRSPSRENLELLTTYKQRKAVAFVERGYSVGWYPDSSARITVYIPEWSSVSVPSVRAAVEFSEHPSPFGIDRGRIVKLRIRQHKTDLIARYLGEAWEHVSTFFDYDRKHRVNRLSLDPTADALYRAIIDELN